MISDLKLGYRVLRYGYDLKSNCILAAACLGFGILYYILDLEMGMGQSALIAGIMLLCVAMVPTQMLQSLNITNLVQASPARKRMLTSAPALISCAGMMTIYLVIVLVRGIEILICPEPERLYAVCNELLIQALYSIGIMLYLGAAYKYFVVSSLLELLILGLGFFAGRLVNVFHEGNVQGGLVFGMAVLLGAALVLFGGLAQYLVSLLVYRAPMSKRAQAASLRKML